MSSPSRRLYATSAPERISRTSESRWAARLEHRLHDTDIHAEHIAAFKLWALVGSGVIVASWLVFGIGWAIGWLVGVVAAPAAYVRVRSGRRPRLVISQLPDAIDMIARSLRSGATLRAALAETVDDAPRVIAEELELVRDALERGQPAPIVLREWAERSPSPEIRIVAAALSLASMNEAGTLQGLEGVAQSLRDRTALRAEIRSLTAQASVSMQALVVLPLGFLVVDAAGSRRVLHVLLHEPIGRISLVAGIGLNGIGWLWMRRLIRRRLP